MYCGLLLKPREPRERSCFRSRRSRCSINQLLTRAGPRYRTIVTRKAVSAFITTLRMRNRYARRKLARTRMAWARATVIAIKIDKKRTGYAQKSRARDTVLFSRASSHLAGGRVSVADARYQSRSRDYNPGDTRLHGARARSRAPPQSAHSTKIKLPRN